MSNLVEGKNNMVETARDSLPPSSFRRRPVLLVFVDGLGLGSDDPAVNPIAGGSAPCIRDLLANSAFPLDATLGVAGIPQSATGQATLLTGRNAAKEAGRHVEGFPGPGLKRLVREHGVLRRLHMAGVPCTFANAYYLHSLEDAPTNARQSVTTVAALSAFGSVRCRDALERNDAVYQDITREALLARGYTGPVISPEQSAEHLASIVMDHRFTLFEYFQTDRAGHSREPAFVAKVLRTLDSFIARLVLLSESAGFTLLITSDHGNIEDVSTHAHTLNPVPFVEYGRQTDRMQPEPADLTGVVPRILRLLDSASIPASDDLRQSSPFARG